MKCHQAGQKMASEELAEHQPTELLKENNILKQITDEFAKVIILPVSFMCLKLLNCTGEPKSR